MIIQPNMLCVYAISCVTPPSQSQLSLDHSVSCVVGMTLPNDISGRLCVSWPNSLVTPIFKLADFFR